MQYSNCTTRTNTVVKGAELMFSIDPMSRMPVYEQLIEQIERYVLTGILKPTEQLPSVRALSMSLSVNPNTIQKAYGSLDERKIIFSVPGKGCFVSTDAVSILSKKARKELSDFEKELKILKLAGIEKDELLEIINKIFDERG